MSRVDVSVVITTFNRERLVLQAVESALVQTGVSLEIIVMDDSANGSARSAIESLKNPKVRYERVSGPSNGRPAAGRNEGAKLAVGEYIHFLDDDDLLEQGTLAVLSEALASKPGAGMAFGRVVPFGDNEAILRHQRQYFERATRTARGLRGRMHLTARLLFRESILVNSACMTTRRAFEASGGFDGEIPVCEDVELWARVVRVTDYVFVDRPVLNYRTGEPSIMHSLKESDPKLRISYSRMQQKYRERYGSLEFYALKLASRIPPSQSRRDRASSADVEYDATSGRL
jgi:glycosyltransferase involved in cell wall biosynthesis